MDANAMATVIFCSHLCVDEAAKPLEPKEWSVLLSRLAETATEPGELVNFCFEDFKKRLYMDEAQAERFMRLIGRSEKLVFELGRYESMGIRIVTRADADYPKRLTAVLKNGCPPLFYYAGELSILEHEFAGYAGSRSVKAEDIEFTAKTVRKTVSKGYSTVSGGAKGTDKVAEQETLRAGGTVAEYLADSLLKKLKKSDVVSAIQSEKLLLLSVTKPDSGFNTGVAMMRNRYIYAQSTGTVIVKADLGKGGTWNGAIDNLRHHWCETFCWDNAGYKGNLKLIEKGAVPIDESWDCELRVAKHDEDQQLSIFDI